MKPFKDVNKMLSRFISTLPQDAVMYLLAGISTHTRHPWAADSCCDRTVTCKGSWCPREATPYGKPLKVPGDLGMGGCGLPVPRGEETTTLLWLQVALLQLRHPYTDVLEPPGTCTWAAWGVVTAIAAAGDTAVSGGSSKIQVAVIVFWSMVFACHFMWKM